ncbi:MFS transporter [Variovorax sp. Sphag1AA]|uniref:CynX/NimT family MFS transporter n=1 Tax=Variovorax sp. Sphag1AA TaxID=2587027 RepID=UPI001610A3DC|nr:MFS transporter [Variovorax sp. Sphag1AA]MBB3180286.1 CP family cyanate transporter-like MFS transporter [Variovorax sp. Sphag1AA]
MPSTARASGPRADVRSGATASAPASQATSAAPAQTRARQLLLGLSLILIAFNLRPVFGSLSVLLPEVMKDTGLGASGASLLTTLPLLCLGIFAAPAPALARRFGPERTLLGALVLICIGTLLRGTGDLTMLFASSAMAGAGIAVGNVLLPGLVKRDFSSRAAMMTGLYTLAVCAGASSAAAFTVPLEHLFDGSWTAALAFWALPAGLVVLLWAPQALAARPRPSAPSAHVGSLWRDPLAWQVTGFMGLQSSLAYIVMGWLSPILRERGLDSQTAGYVLAVSILVQLGTCLVTPSVAARCRDQRGLALGLTVVILVSLLAFLFAPLESVWLWTVLLGLGQGGSFALALALIVMRSPDANVTAQLSAMAQGCGYVLASAGPLIAGLLRGWTGGFESSAALMVVIGIGMAWSGWGAGRRMTVLQPRHP